MKCPSCGSEQQFVIDSRGGGDLIVRRKRRCAACGNRWRTIEGPVGSPATQTLEALEELKTLRAENAALKARLSRATAAIRAALSTTEVQNGE